MAKPQKAVNWDSEGAAERAKDVPVEVKPLALWESGTGRLLGYFPGIHGPNRWASYVFLMPAIPHLDLGTCIQVDVSKLYATPELAMHAWAEGTPVPFDKTTPAIGVNQSTRERISGSGLYRNPSLPREAAYLDNPFEDRKEAVIQR